MKISICIPSYKRPKIKTLQYIKNNVKVFVCETEFDEYKKNNNVEIVKMPKGVQGNISRVRNWIIENELKKNKMEAVCIIDDDMSYIKYFENNSGFLLKEDEWGKFLKKYTQLCYEWGYKFWGINISNDRQNYREYTPFSTLSYIGAPFGVILAGNECRYDENIPLKEDYDFFLQNIKKYRGALRVNKFYYQVKQSEQVGGCAIIRNSKEEIKQLELLEKKWGTNIVKRDTNKIRTREDRKIIDYNPIIKVPLKGV